LKYFSYSYWSNWITEAVYANVPQARNESREKIEYGAYMALSEITKAAILLISAALFHVFTYVVGIILLFGLLRWCLGGIHAKSHWACLVSYLFFVYGILVASIFINLDKLIFEFIVMPPAFLITYLYAPADLPVKPVTSKKQRKRLRVTGFIVISVLAILAYISPLVWFNIIMLTIALTVVLMTPPIYILTKNKYGKEEMV
jgi:accessory gene regulator B